MNESKNIASGAKNFCYVNAYLVDCPACAKPIYTLITYEITISRDDLTSESLIAPRAGLKAIGAAMSHDCTPVVKR